MRNKCFVQTAMLAGLCAISFGTHANGNQRIARPYDWTVELKTGTLSDAFDYANSHLHGLEKVKVTYVHAQDFLHANPQPQNYESLWYHDGKPLGLERRSSFAVTPGDGVSILVTHKDGHGSAKEYKAAANAILRLILDSYLNHNAVVSVRLPEDSFTGIAQALQDQGCLEDLSRVDDPNATATAINIFLQTEPDADQTMTLYYL